MNTEVGSPESSVIRSVYDRWSSVYDHDGNPLAALEEPFVREQLGSVRGLTVLDLGCGTGRHALWLASSGAIVTAVDFSEGMLAQARRKPGADAVRFVVHDIENRLPFEDGFFDRVVSGLVVEHIEDLHHIFFEVRRVLRPGGRALLTAMHPAMFLKGRQAKFTDPDTGEILRPGSHAHQISDFVMAGLRNNLSLLHLGEHSPSEDFASQYPRSEKHIGWPMLVVLEFGGSALFDRAEATDCKSRPITAWMRPSTLKETTRVSTIDYSSDPTYAYSVNQSLEYIEARSWRLELGDVAAD